MFRVRLFLIHFAFTGRVHSAIVADINYAMRSATVEWFEQGETKGKEIDMVAITTLNPELIIVKPSERNNIQDTNSTQSNLKPLQRVSERTYIDTNTIKNKREISNIPILAFVVLVHGHIFTFFHPRSIIQ